MVIPSAALKRAASHHGLIRLSDLRAAYLTTKQIDSLVASDQLVRVHSGIYRLAGAPETWEQQQLAACFATGGVASHRAAAKLWNVQLPGCKGADWPIEVTVGRRNPGRPRGVTVHRSADLPKRGCPGRHGIPVTTPQRMLIDLGAIVGEQEVARAVEQCVVSGRLSIATIHHELDQVARKGRPGVRLLRSVLADWPLGDGRADSELEVAFARLCKKAGLPDPQFQYELTLGGRRRRIDFAYPDKRIAIEIDGFGCRTDRNVFQDERWRQNDLIATGWQVLRFTWGDVMNRPSYVASQIRTLLERATTS